MRALAGPQAALEALLDQRLEAVGTPWKELIRSMLEAEAARRRTADQLVHSLRIQFPLQPLARHGSISL